MATLAAVERGAVGCGGASVMPWAGSGRPAKPSLLERSQQKQTLRARDMTSFYATITRTALLLFLNAAWCSVDAQRLEPARFARAIALPDVRRDQGPPFGPSTCEGSLAQAVIVGAAAGAVTTALTIVVLSPLLAVAFMGSSRELTLGPFLAGGAAAGALLGGIRWTRACG